MADMDKLMEFLQKEVPSNAGDLNDSINNTLEIIERTRAALAAKVTRLFQDGEDEFTIFTEANKQLGNIEKYLKNLIDNTCSEQKQNEEIKNNLSNKITDAVKPDYDSCKIDETKPYNLDADFSRKRPIGFTFEGKKYNVQNWNRLLVMVCELLNRKNPKLFQSFPEDESMQGRTRKYFIRQSSPYHKKIAGTGIWVLTNNNGSANCRTIIKMFEKYDIPITSMEIFIQSDYSLLDEEDTDKDVKKN